MMTTTIATMSLAILALIALSTVLFVQSSNRKGQIVEARKETDEAHKVAIEGALRVAAAAGLDHTEFAEMLVEQTTRVRVTSDVWDVELPYGKWAKFKDPDGDPEAMIRGFWPDFVGRLIGVGMPVGSKYVMHQHPWPETLIGGSGLVWVEVEGSEGEIVRHRLGPGDVVIIPPKVNHAVARAEEQSYFICVWGLPEKTP